VKTRAIVRKGSWRFFAGALLWGMLALAAAGCGGPTGRAQSATPAAPSQPVDDRWDDREIFRAGLVKSEQRTLDELPGASVYHLEVRIADDLGRLDGRERVRYTNQEKEPLDAVYFQLFPNMEGGRSEVMGVLVDGQPVEPVLEEDDSSLRVPLAKKLEEGQQAVIQMDFSVEVPGQGGGNYGLLVHTNNSLALDGFYPAIPVFDGKGWHKGRLPANADTTFQDASFYVAKVTAPAGLKLVASGLEVERTEEGTLQVVTFAAGPARDFYMAGSEDFSTLSEMVGETRVNSHAPASSAAGSQLALQTAVKAIESYSQRLGAYPYTEFDVVSSGLEGGASGIEYPGIVGMNGNMYDPGAIYLGLPAPVMLEGTVAHEVGHQWFYNAVGNDQMSEPWLDEAVTQYVTGLYYLDNHGRQGWDGFRDGWLSRWDRVGRAAKPIGLPAGSYQGREYGAIVYGRGPLFVEALAQKMGQAGFDAFLREYVQANWWRIGTEASFRQLAEKQCGCDLGPMFAEWVDGK